MSMPASYRSGMVLRLDPGDLAPLTQWILEACAAARIPEKTAFAVQLCLDEAVANIMQHGRDARVSEIAADLERTDAGVVLDIQDDGGPFDPTAFASPPPPATLDAASVGGLGIHLMRRFARRMDYRRHDGRNHLRLTFDAA
jgi:anti-sigma regulatory factor (Ser/Thr protein kinase)